MEKSRNTEKIKNIIAVASGKGGVGKSTVAVSLAYALKRKNMKVGLLDADIYGPSVPLLTGISGKPAVKDEMMVPLEKDGIKMMSIGFMLKEEDAVIWRGPMMSNALKQFINDVSWGELDFLIADLPPGTGDASLTCAQVMGLTGVVIVTTPQDTAAKIAAKAAAMFKQLNVRISGIIENMAYYSCPECGAKSEIFPGSKTGPLSGKVDAPLLGRLPVFTGFTGEDGIRINESNGQINSEFDKIAIELIKSIKEGA